MKHLFLLLQINDAAFPIGSYTHSYGLETYIQKRLVFDRASAEEFIRQNAEHSFLYSELLPAALAYKDAALGNVSALCELEDILFASKTPRELREASSKLGSRFARMANIFPLQTNIFKSYQERAGKGHLSHSIAYGVFCASAGIPKTEALASYLYAQVSAMVTNCVKTIPLSQTDGQQILADCHSLYYSVLNQLNKLTADDLCRSAPGLDIRAMQHEHLYSRLYMS